MILFTRQSGVVWILLFPLLCVCVCETDNTIVLVHEIMRVWNSYDVRVGEGLSSHERVRFEANACRWISIETDHVAPTVTQNNRFPSNVSFSQVVSADLLNLQPTL